MAQNRARDIMDGVQIAECRLEHILETTRFAMDIIEGSPKSSNPNYLRIYHLLGVMCESMENLHVSLGDISQTATLTAKQPA